MNKDKTAFKHPNCGGIILQFDQNGTRVYECDQCGESANEIDQLIVRGLVIIRTKSKTSPASIETIRDSTRLEETDPQQTILTTGKKKSLQEGSIRSQN